MIEIKKLTKIYDSVRVLNSISMSIKDGEIFTVMGPSGCGKSTLLKCIIKLIVPEEGSIVIDGKDILKVKNEIELKLIRRDFGYLFQEGALFDSLSVWENVAFGLKYLTDIPRERYFEIAREKLNLVGLKDVEHKKISELSGGMKKRVALARAIAHNPNYLLYDEPTTGLDPITAERIYDLIKETSEKLRVTSIVVTHDVRLALTVSSRIAILNSGSLVMIDTPQGILDSADPFVKEFIESPMIDWYQKQKVKYRYER